MERTSVRDHGSKAGFSAALRTFREDGCARATLLYVGLLSLPYLLPFLDDRQLDRYTRTTGFLVFIPAVLVALQYRLGEVRSTRERRFWSLLTFGYGFWWIAELVERLAPADWGALPVQLTSDGLIALYYVAAFFALTARPHRGSGTRPPAGLHEPLEHAVLVLGLFVYLVLIPSVLEPRSYLTGFSSLVFFTTLDLVVASRFVQVALNCGSARWRHLYLLVGSTFAIWGGLDAFEAMAAAGWLPMSTGSRWMVLWHLPFVSIVLAGRLRHLDAPGDGKTSADDPFTGDAAPASGGPLLLGIFSLSAVHLSLSLMGLVTAATRGARELVTLICLAILAGLAFGERRALRRETRQQSTLLGSLIESSPLPIVLLDAEARVITCNPAFESLFVYSREELRGETLEGFISDDETRAEALDNVRTVLRGDTVQCVTRRTRRDGSAVDVRLFGIPLRSGGRLIGAFGLYQDITRQKRSERQLRESEERFRRLAEATFEGILISVDGKIVDANQQLADIFGFSLAEVLGAPVGARVVPESKELVRERMQTDYDRPYEVEAFRKDGQRIRIEVRGKQMPLKTRVARVTALRDVTRHRALEEQLRQSQKMEAIGRLAAGVAHDFNNLLTVIVGRGMLLVDQLEPESQPHRDAEEIAQAAVRATHLTGQLLTFGRRQPLEPQVLDLNDLTTALEKMLGRVLREDIELVLAPSPEPALVEADPVQLEQVLLNLAINAQDAMPDGGRLTITVRSAGTGDPSAAMGLAPGDYVGLTVRDTGVGMDDDVRARAFEPFFTTKGKGEGTGLGLATVYGIVQQTGGAITIDSHPGAGTTFTVLLPRAGGEVAPPEPLFKTAAAPRGSQTVLVVEDVQEVCTFVAEALRLYGYRTFTAEDPRRALEILEELDGDLDLLLTDVAMPGMSGFQLADKVREVRPQTRVLYMSGYTDSPDFRRRRDRSRITLLRKPFTHTELADKVREVLSDPAGP